MKKYYVITGLDEGYSIKPYIVEGENELDSALSVYGDMCRRYEPFNTLESAQKRLQELENRR